MNEDGELRMRQSWPFFAASNQTTAATDGKLDFVRSRASLIHVAFWPEFDP